MKKLSKDLIMVVSTALLLTAGTIGGNELKSKASRTANVTTIERQTAKAVGGYGQFTTGGAKNVKRPIKVSSIKQLRAKLKKLKNRPKVIVITKDITGSKANSSAYAKHTVYNLRTYLKANNPKHLNKSLAKQQENDRKKAMNKQKKDVEVDVPSNTTIVSENNVRIKGVNFITTGNNIIFNHLNMINPIDNFPQWDAKDGKQGNFNSQYDSITAKHCNNLWINDCTFTDQPNLDHVAGSKTYGRQYEQHDGVTDITDGSNHVTISHNVYRDHNKTILIGSSDKNTKDAGKLNTSIINNHFINDVQRMPRVRYGHVDVSNNVYFNNSKQPYALEYLIGFGANSTITGHNDEVTVPKMSVSKLKKRVVKDMKHGKKLGLKRFKVNGKLFDIYNRGNKIEYKSVK